MNIILKHTLNSIKKNKIQVGMIIITIIIVAIAVFMTFSMNDIFYNVQSLEFDRIQQDGNIMMTSSLDSQLYFSGSRINDFVNTYKEDIESYQLFLRISCVLVTDTSSKIINIESTNMNQYFQKYPHNFVETTSKDLDYDQVIISKRFAENYNIKLEDNLQLFISILNTTKFYSVYAIAENEGIFSSPSGMQIVVESNSLDFNNLYNCAVFKLTNPKTTTPLFIEELKEEFPNFTVADYKNDANFNSIVTSNTLVFNVGIMFIMLMMALILFSSYLIIAKQRVNEMVIFKASGATPKQTFLILMGEVVLYGIIGSLIGVILGRVILYFALKAILPTASAIITFEWYKYFISIIATILTAVLSTIIPILASSKKTVRELTTNITKEIKYKKPLVLIVLSILIIFILTIFSLVKTNYIIILLLFMLLLVALLVHYLTPYLILMSSKILGKTNKAPSKLASLSLKRNTSSQLVAVLLAIVISFSFMISQVLDLVGIAIVPYNSRFTADYTLINAGANYDNATAFYNKYDKLDGIKEMFMYSSFYPNKATVNGKDLDYSFTVISLHNPNQLNNFTTKDVNSDVIKKLADTEAGIVLNNDLALRYNIKLNDKIKFQIISGSSFTQKVFNSDFEFTVVGIEHSVTEYDQIAFINEKYNFFENEKITGYSFFVTADNKNTETFIKLRDVFLNNTIMPAILLDFDEWAYLQTKGLEGLDTLLGLIQIIIGIITFLGVINIMVVTFFDRKKEFRIYKNNGLTDNIYNGLALYESLMIAMVGFILSIILSIAINTIMPTFTAIVSKYLSFSLFSLTIPLLSFMSCIVFIFCWKMISVKVKKKILSFESYNDRNN